jgi:N-acetylglucosaminyldiphosphoundecaprenol N-acetyl-beta-D-mannosaminyltransferase
MNRIAIMDVAINNLSLQETIETIKLKLKARIKKPMVIFTPNTEIVMRCSKDNELKQIINQGDLVLPDGIGLVIASKIKRIPLKERVTGYDTSIEILKIASKNHYSVFLLGGEPHVTQKAAITINETYGDIVVGWQHGYFSGYHTNEDNSDEEKIIIQRINELQPDILFVGLGSPKQEKWISHYKDNLDVSIIIGNGGTMDVIAGKVRRAPVIFQKMGLEWLYRLVKEPHRIKRQMLLPIFVFKVFFGRKNIVKDLSNSK